MQIEKDKCFNTIKLLTECSLVNAKYSRNSIYIVQIYKKSFLVYEFLLLFKFSKLILKDRYTGDSTTLPWYTSSENSTSVNERLIISSVALASLQTINS